MASSKNKNARAGASSAGRQGSARSASSGKGPGQGRGAGKGKGRGTGTAAGAAAMEEEEVSELTRAVTSHEEDPIKGLDTTIKWQMVWLEAIALAWRDPVFKRKLLEQPRLTLLEYFNFDLGPYVKLTIREASRPNEQESNPKTPMEHVFGGWDPASDPLKSEMIMALPPEPPDIKDQGVALAFYNATGRAYPFTCC